MIEANLFQWIAGLLTLVCAFGVILARNPVVSAVMLLGTLFLTGGLYFGLGFYFIGAVQILIYAGAISVLFIFIVMLLDVKPMLLQIPGRKLTYGLATLAGVVLVVALLMSVVPNAGNLVGFGDSFRADALDAASAKSISLQFLSKYMIPFQVTGLLILASVMGVTCLGKPRKKLHAGESQKQAGASRGAAQS